MLQLVCPKCKHQAPVADDAEGKAVVCATCGHRWQAPASEAPGLMTEGLPALPRQGMLPELIQTATEAQEEAKPAAELPAGLPAEVYGLGTPLAVYENRTLRLLRRLAEAVIFWVLVLLSVWWGSTLLLGFVEGTRTGRGLALGLVCVIWPVAFLALALYSFFWMWRTTWVRAALVFPGQLVIVLERPATFVFLSPWLWREKPAGVLTFRWEEIEECWGSSPSSCTLKRRDGEQISLGNPFFLPTANISTLTDTIRREVARCLLPRALAAYRAGGTVDFGPLRVSQAGLSHSAETIPWAEVKSISMDRWKISVEKERFERQELADRQSIPNLDVFVGLIEEGIGVPVKSLAPDGKKAAVAVSTAATPVRSSGEIEGDFTAFLIREVPESLHEDVSRLGQPREAYRVDFREADGKATAPFGILCVAVAMIVVGGFLAARRDAPWSFIGLACALVGLNGVRIGVRMSLPLLRTLDRRMVLLLFAGYASAALGPAIGFYVTDRDVLLFLLAAVLTIGPTVVLMSLTCKRVMHAVLVFSEGLLYLRRQDDALNERHTDADVLRWAEAEEVWQAAHALGRQVGYVPEFRVRRRDGAWIALPHFLPDIARLGDTVQRETARHLLPHARQTYQAGGTIPFGRLRAGQEGLLNGSRLLRWSEIEEIKVTRDDRPRVLVRQREGGRDWCNIPLSAVPNIKLLEGFVKQVVRES